ncbi:MAG TPA: hypothetical protein VMF63_14705, partial [Opitutaceae bacterium]|nr:hypothetical protein [Opitutaceae bacterium]
RSILKGLDPAAVEAVFRRHAARLQAARATPGPGLRHKTGSCQLLVNGPQESPHQVGESPFSLGAGSGRDPARNLEP